MPSVTIDLLGEYASQLAKEVNRKDNGPKLDLDEVRSLILNRTSLPNWNETKVKFNELHVAPNRSFGNNPPFGRVIATEVTAWSDARYSHDVEPGKIQWVRLGTTSRSLKEIAQGFEREKLDTSGLGPWLEGLEVAMVAGRRAKCEKIEHQGKRYNLWIHDATFLARIQGRVVQAAATIRSQLRVPAFRSDSLDDSVLNAEIELLRVSQHGPLFAVPPKSWDRGESAKPTTNEELDERLHRSIPMLLAGAARDILTGVYYAAWDAINEAGEYGMDREPVLNLTVYLPAGYEGQETRVTDAVLNVDRHQKRGYMERSDEAARIASLTVAVMSQERKEQRLQERLAAHESESAREALRVAGKALRQPGDEFALVKIELPALAVGENGLLYQTRLYEIFAEILEETGLPPQHILSLAEADFSWIDSETNYKEIEKWIEKAASVLHEHPHWPFDESSYDFAYDCIRSSLQLRGLPRKSVERAPTIWLVVDTATLFPYAEHSPGNADLSAFLSRAVDPSTHLSMGAKPKRLKVAGALLIEHPEVQDWANDQGVELVRPTSGFDAGSTHIRLWRKTVDTVMYWGVDERDHREWWRGVRSLSDHDLGRAVANKVRVHQDQKIGEAAQYGPERIDVYPYLDGIDGVNARRYKDWKAQEGRVERRTSDHR